MPAARIADEALREIGEADDVESGTLLVRRGTAMTNGRTPSRSRAPTPSALLPSRARPTTAAWSSRRSSSGCRSDPTIPTSGSSSRTWQSRLAPGTRRSARCTRARSSSSQIMRVKRRRSRSAVSSWPRRAGCRESLAWLHHADVEIGLVSGDWDGAVASARRALDDRRRERIRPRGRADMVGGSADRVGARRRGVARRGLRLAHAAVPRAREPVSVCARHRRGPPARDRAAWPPRTVRPGCGGTSRLVLRSLREPELDRGARDRHRRVACRG